MWNLRVLPRLIAGSAVVQLIVWFTGLGRMLVPCFMISFGDRSPYPILLWVDG
jgi:hypothetical protein